MIEQVWRERQGRSQRAFYRAMAGGSRDARVVELDAVQATLVPVREWFSIFNSVLYTNLSSLERCHAQLAGAYAEAGIKAWTVWVPPTDTETGAMLESRGHHRDSAPMLFAADIQALDLNPAIELDLDRDPSWQLVAEINDRAHGVLEPWSMAAAFQTMHDPASHLHIARMNQAPVSALIAREHQADCYFWFVATVPEARGDGIASELMRHAAPGSPARLHHHHARIHPNGRNALHQPRLPPPRPLHDVGTKNRLTTHTHAPGAREHVLSGSPSQPN